MTREEKKKYNMRIARKRNVEINELMDLKSKDAFILNKTSIWKTVKEKPDKKSMFQYHKGAAKAFQLFKNTALMKYIKQLRRV